MVPQRSRERPDQRGQHRPVGPVQPRARVPTSQHHDLMAQHEQLGVLRRARAGQQHQPADDPSKDPVQQPQRHEPRSSPASHRSPINAGHKPQPEFWHPTGRRRCRRRPPEDRLVVPVTNRASSVRRRARPTSGVLSHGRPPSCALRPFARRMMFFDRCTGTVCPSSLTDLLIPGVGALPQQVQSAVIIPGAP
jgi:hypothetical protein